MVSDRGLLSIWTVYDKPRDMPQHYVARRFVVDSAGPTATEEFIASTDLDMVRRSLSMRGLTVLPRKDNDEPHIVECWL